jgi:hypothetical protein
MLHYILCRVVSLLLFLGAALCCLIGMGQVLGALLRGGGLDQLASIIIAAWAFVLGLVAMKVSRSAWRTARYP